MKIEIKDQSINVKHKILVGHLGKLARCNTKVHVETHRHVSTCKYMYSVQWK